MAANLTDIIEFGENKSRGPLYNKSTTVVSSAYVKVLSANPARKFLLIKPASGHLHIHFLSPGITEAGAPFIVTDGNSFTVNSGNSDAPLRFDTFVPTNAVWMKASTGTPNVTIFES
jgi:hypothetical protein